MNGKKNIKAYPLGDLLDKYIGKRGTTRREKFEFELQMDLIGEVIRMTRLKRKLTQEMLGKKIGVKKAQISKLENGSGNVTINTIQKVFSALNTPVTLNVSI